MRNWSLNAKISMVIAILVTSMAGIAGLGLAKMNTVKGSLDYIVDEPAKRLDMAHTLRSLFLAQQISQKNFILENSKEGMEEMKTRIAATDAEIRKAIPAYLAIATEAGKKNMGEFQSAYDQWTELNGRIMKLALEGKDKEAAELSGKEGRALRLKGEESVGKIVKLNQDMMEKESDRTDAEYAAARNLMIAMSLAATLASLAIAFVVLRSLSRAIDRVINSLNDNSAQVTSAAAQIASSSEELSQAATEQASSLEETASSIEEMNSMVKKSSDNATESSALAGSSLEGAEKGKRVVTEVIRAIADIDTSNAEMMSQIEQSNQQIGEIVKVISEIGEKTKVINDIVFQTKLLSFNASVEAARAGEHGKGFAVVAEEVGNLAQMSGNAAKEISTMLADSIRKVEGIVTETKQRVERLVVTSKQKVEAGTTVAHECGEVLEEIVRNVRTVAQKSGEIASACQEQSQGVHEITKAMSQLDQVTQTNAATSEEAASAAEQLSAQAEALRGVVGVLVSTVKGGAEGHVGATTTPAAKVPARARPSSNVVSLRGRSPAPALKKAAGAELSVPSESDPRFEEV